MDYEESTLATVSVYEAIRELEKHGIDPYYDGPSASILDNDTGETIAKTVIADQVKGGDVLAWLGY